MMSVFLCFGARERTSRYAQSLHSSLTEIPKHRPAQRLQKHRTRPRSGYRNTFFFLSLGVLRVLAMNPFFVPPYRESRMSPYSLMRLQVASRQGSSSRQ